MESLFRPGNPTILCFDGAADGASYERVKLNILTIVHHPKRPLLPAGAFILFITIMFDYQKFSKNTDKIFDAANEIINYCF
jgi:hypothetical protein